MRRVSGLLRGGRRAAVVAAASVVAATLALGACGSDDDDGGSGDGSLEIAYLSFAVANSYDAPMLAAAEAVAADNDANVTVFDANNDPKTQYSQLQDAIQTGQYDGIITQPISSTNLIPLVEQALDEGIAVANIDQILGPDLGTAEKQVDGLNVNVTFIPTEIGTKLGEQVVAACEQNNLDPCRVGYLFDIKASALDTAIREGFDEATAGSPVEIVAEGESFFTPQGGLAAAQDMLQGNPDLNLIVGADQGLQGAQEAIGDRKVVLVGYGGSAAAKAQVSSGAWFADVAQAPGTEGREGMRLLIESIRDDADPEAVNVLEGLPADGVMKKDNAGEFDPEWPG